MGYKKAMRALRLFIEERDWDQFQSPENLAKSISIEAAELLECYQWSPDADLSCVKDELADVMAYCLLLAHRLELDPHDLILEKLVQNREKYPVEKARGKSVKYDRL